MTGPTVYTKAIISLHKELFDNNDLHNIVPATDINYYKDTISYRLYSIDYGKFFSYHNQFAHLLYINKKHWRQEEKEYQLLK